MEPLGVHPRAFAGFAGRLPASGKATGTIDIPADAGLIGLKISLAMVTLDPALPELIEETSDATTFTIQ